MTTTIDNPKRIPAALIETALMQMQGQGARVDTGKTDTQLVLHAEGEVFPFSLGFVVGFVAGYAEAATA